MDNLALAECINIQILHAWLDDSQMHVYLPQKEMLLNSLSRDMFKTISFS